MIELDIKFEGIEKVLEAFNQAESLALDALEEAIDESAEDLIGKAMSLAPKLTGDLEGSGTNDGTTRTANEISATVGFRGLDYAARRHEEVYTPGMMTRGKPAVDGMIPGRKYLERPLVKYVNRYGEEWAAAVRKVLS